MGADRPLTETALKAARDSRRGDAGADDSDVGAAFNRFTPRPPDFPGGGIDGPFDGSFLTAPIGPGEANRPHDVRHASRMLAANGRLARETDAFDRDVEQAIVGLQKDLGVKQDARAKPNGPTETLVQRGFADGRLTLPPTDRDAPPRPPKLPRPGEKHSPKLMPLPRPGGLSDAEFAESATPRRSTQTAESAVPPRTQPRPTIGDASAGGKPPRHAERTAREQNTLAERTAERLGLSPETIREAGIEGEAALTALGMYEYMQDRDKPRINALAVKLYQAGHDKLAGKILGEIAFKNSIERTPPEKMDAVSLQNQLEGVDQALEFLDFAEPIAGRVNPALPGYLGLMRWTLERARPALENNLKSRFGSH